MDDVAYPQAPDETRKRQSVARLAFGAAVVLLALWTFAEYLPALGWAGVIAIATWPGYARIARAETLTIRNAEYISAVELQADRLAGGDLGSRRVLGAGRDDSPVVGDVRSQLEQAAQQS